MGYVVCTSVAFPAFTSLQGAAYRPHDPPAPAEPETPTSAVCPWPYFFAHATVASRSAITRANGTFDTALSTMSFIASFDASHWRA